MYKVLTMIWETCAYKLKMFEHGCVLHCSPFLYAAIFLTISHLFFITANRQRQLERSRSRVGLKQPMMATSEISIDEPDEAPRANARRTRESNASTQPNGVRSSIDQVTQDTDDLIARLKAL